STCRRLPRGTCPTVRRTTQFVQPRELLLGFRPCSWRHFGGGGTLCPPPFVLAPRTISCRCLSTGLAPPPPNVSNVSLRYRGVISPAGGESRSVRMTTSRPLAFTALAKHVTRFRDAPLGRRRAKPQLVRRDRRRLIRRARSKPGVGWEIARAVAGPRSESPRTRPR